MRVVDGGGGAVPGTDQAPLVQEETECAPDDPPMIPLPFLPHLSRAAPFAHGMDQRDPLAVSPPSTVGAARKRVVHAVCVLKSRAKRVRSGPCGNHAR